MIGIIQEQHPERCRLFMQWKQMSWPVLVDSLNLLEVTAVPITLFVDEAGYIRKVRPQPSDLADFLAATTAAPAAGTQNAKPATRPDIDALKNAAAQSGTAAAWAELAHAMVHWTTPSGLDDAIDSYRRALEISPGDGPTHFRAGVAYRKRYDSAQRQPEDFRRAIEHWKAALDIDPNQYIWRRRIQQYGPRLDKPYPFYDWIHTARNAIQSRGDRPVILEVEPSGAEIAAPAREIEGGAGSETEPDSQARIHRDDRPLIQIESVVVTSTDAKSRDTARVHLLFRPNEAANAHWNNESDPLVVWIDPPEGGNLNSNHYTAPNAREAVSDEPRQVEFELKVDPAGAARATSIRGYALYYVCEGIDGTCLYRRQEFTVPMPDFR